VSDRLGKAGNRAAVGYGGDQQMVSSWIVSCRIQVAGARERKGCEELAIAAVEHEDAVVDAVEREDSIIGLIDRGRSGTPSEGEYADDGLGGKSTCPDDRGGQKETKAGE